GAVYVTHNLGVVAQLCERVVVMYAGEIMEDAAAADLFARPLHPYTVGLLKSVPRLGQTKREMALQTIPGRPPSLTELPEGCVYAPRCPLAIEICQTKPPLETPAAGRLVRCHRWQEIATGAVKVTYEDGGGAIASAGLEARAPLLHAAEMTKHFA